MIVIPSQHLGHGRLVGHTHLGMMLGSPLMVSSHSVFGWAGQSRREPGLAELESPRRGQNARNV